MLALDLLDDDQRAAIDFGLSGEDALMFCDVGTGKTVIGHTIAQNARLRSQVSRWLVTAPLLVCYEWLDQKNQWAHLIGEKVELATGNDKRVVAVVVRVRITAAVENNRMVEKRAVAFLCFVETL